MALEDSGATPRNTPTASRGQAAPAVVADEAKRTEKTGGRGTDLEAGGGVASGNGPANSRLLTADAPSPVSKPRRRTVGSIVVPELPWKRGQ